MIKYIAYIFTLFSIVCNISYGIMVKDRDGKIIVKTNSVSHIYGEVNQRTFETFRDSTEKIKPKTDHLILINSPGGYVTYGNMILDIMKEKQKNGVKFYCYVVSAAHSMAFNILSFCDVRIGEQNAQYLVHKMALSIVMQTDRRLTAKTLRSIAADLDSGDEPFRQQNSKMLHYTLKEYDIIADNDTIFTSNILIHRGYLDFIGNLFILDN